MAFETVVKDLEIKQVKDLKEENIPVIVNVSAGGSAISRVISITSRACVNNITTNAGSAQIDGKIRSNILVCNTEGVFECLSGTTNFSLPIVNTEITVESILLACAQATVISSIQASENMVNFTVNVVIKPSLVVKNQIKVLENLSPLAEQKRDNLVYKGIISASMHDFDLNIELDLPTSISKVLSVESQSILKNVETGNDLVSIQGEIYCNMVYLTADEEPKLKNHRYSQEFTHEILANGVVLTDEVVATLEDCESNFELTGEINSAKGTILYTSKLKTNLYITQSKTIDVVVDAFCPVYNFKYNTANLLEQSIQNAFCVEKIDGNISLGEDSPRIDKVLSVGESNVVVQNISCSEGLCVVTGRLFCDVVYKLDTDIGEIESVLAEVPFEISIKNDLITQESGVKLDIKAKDIDARNKRAKEIDLLAEISILATITNSTSVQVLQNIELESKRPENTSSVGYYLIPEAKDLWEASKMLLVSGDLIMEQNPNLQFPITEPQKVLVYKQKSLD